MVQKNFRVATSDDIVTSGYRNNNRQQDCEFNTSSENLFLCTRTRSKLFLSNHSKIVLVDIGLSQCIPVFIQPGINLGAKWCTFSNLTSGIRSILVADATFSCSGWEVGTVNQGRYSHNFINISPCDWKYHSEWKFNTTWFR